MFKEFKEFAIKGNAVDLAVGVIIGAAFGTIVTSFVKDILMPPLGMVTGGLDFSNKFLVLERCSRRRDLRDTGRRRESWCGHLELRQFHHPDDQLHHRRVLHFSGRASAEQNETAAPTAAPVTKDCPACQMTIPIKATRCPHCTTEFSRA